MDFLTGGRLTEIHLIEIVFYHLTEFLDGFQLIESFNNDFGQTPKF